MARKKMAPADEYAARFKDLLGAKERLAMNPSNKKPTVRVKEKLVCISGYCIILGLSESSGDFGFTKCIPFFEHKSSPTYLAKDSAWPRAYRAWKTSDNPR